MKFKFRTALVEANTTEIELPSLNCILHSEIISQGMYSNPKIKLLYLEPVYDGPEDEQSYRIP